MTAQRSLRLFLLFLAVAFAAPVTAQEIQVPFDEAGRILTIDAQLAQRLDLFPGDFPGLRELRLFRAADGGYILEATTSEEGRVARHRRALTGAEADALRARVTARVAERAPTAGMDQEGRNLLLVQTAALGLGFYGPMAPYIFDADDFSTGFGLYLLTAGAGFFVPYMLTEGHPVTRGMAGLSAYGATRGIAHGYLLHKLIAGEEEHRAYPADPEFPGPYYADSESYERAASATAVLLSVAEGVGGYLWARDAAMTPGEAAAVGMGGDFGLGGGLALAYVLGRDEFDERTVAGMGLAGSVAGIVAGRRIGTSRDYTPGDVTMTYGAGTVGAAVGIAAADIVNLDYRPVVAVGILGAAAGLAVGDRLVRDKDFSTGEASLNALGTVAGAATGLGIGVLLGGEDLDETTAITGIAAGALAGYALTYRAFAPEARARTLERPAVLELRIDPRGLAALGALRAGTGALPLALPVVSGSYRF